MKAMILAAGRGERMRPLTDQTPKPLLRVGGRPLIDWHLDALAVAGVETVVVNVAWLGEQLIRHLEDDRRRGLRVLVSDEGEAALETGGGIRRALPMLGSEPFWVINGDVWSDFDLRTLPREPAGDAHLVLVDNPPHRPTGDFALCAGRVTTEATGQRFTYAGIGCYRPDLFREQEQGRFPLAPLLRQAAAAGRLAGVHHRGRWCDVGTVERLRSLDRWLAGR